jgi:hypothetical protein
MRVLLSSALALLLATVVLGLSVDFVAFLGGDAELAQSAADGGAATPRRATGFNFPRDQRQVRSFEALVMFTTLKAEPRKSWHPGE